MAIKDDEKFASELLNNHLSANPVPGFQCQINCSDPPDLIVTWSDGQQWGVEVTRSYQRVQQLDKGEIDSWESVSLVLRRFAKDIEEETRDIRVLDYKLCLGVPGYFNPWKTPGSIKQWKKETRKSIREHIRSRERHKLHFPGGAIQPGNFVKSWAVMINSPVVEISSDLNTMLQYVFNDKTEDLQKWKGNFFQSWLLILNCYVLANDIVEVERIIRRLVRESAWSATFDGIFWSGYPDRTLFPIRLSEDA